MRQKRFRRAADRPLPFHAESDKEILVRPDVAARTGGAAKRGQVVPFTCAFYHKFY
jgi:hypothetical protein